MNKTFEQDLAEIRRLLAEAYEHYFANSDGHCKSSEGAISIHYPPFFWQEDGHEPPVLEIYSYVLGPHRSHTFKTSKAALQAVRAWHKSEMEHDYQADEEAWEKALVEMNAKES